MAVGDKLKHHKTKKILIKSADVDVKIIKVVNWLNSFGTVYTKYACQGNKKNNPYVVFSCDSSDELFLISSKIGYLGRVYIRTPHEIRLMDFSLEFFSKDDLKIFKEII